MELSRWKIFRGVDPSLISKCKFGKFVHFQGVGFLVLQNDDVYVITDKDSIGYEHDNEVSDVNASKASKVESLCGQYVKDIYGNQYGFAALTTDGCVWMDEDSRDPHRSLMSKKVFLPDSNGNPANPADQLAHGYNYTLCLTSDGQVYAWGNNTCGQLGSGSKSAERKEMAARNICRLTGNIVQVAAGGFTSYALDSSGRVWSWGSYTGDTLGYNASDHQMSPKAIENLYNIRKIAAGRSHFLALSKTGELYFCGSFAYDIPAAPLPTKINEESLGRVIDIASTGLSSCAVFQTKEKVYLWGIWYHQHISEPMATKFTSIEEAFACAMSPIMLHPIAVRSQCHRVEDAWKSAFNDSSTSDVLFIVQNEELHAHKAFLKLRSKYFRKMFDNDWAECSRCGSPIKIKGFSFRIFQAFMHFLYRESLVDPDMSVEDLAELMRAADYYEDEDLRLVSEKKLQSHLTPANACFIYASAVQTNSQNLQDWTVEFMAPVYKEIFKSAQFAKMDSDLKTKLMIHFADLNVFQVSKRRKLQ